MAPCPPRSVIRREARAAIIAVVAIPSAPKSWNGTFQVPSSAANGTPIIGPRKVPPPEATPMSPAA